MVTGTAGPAVKLSSGVGACVRGQSRDGHPDDEDADRAADGGQAIAPAVRLRPHGRLEVKQARVAIQSEATFSFERPPPDRHLCSPPI